jgi:hypothetical protein
MYESQIATLEQQNFNMENAAMTTENLRNTMVTTDAMKSANKELKKQYGKVGLISDISWSLVLTWRPPRLTLTRSRYGERRVADLCPF